MTVELKRALGPWHLWGIAVGLVISGDYFGWNYGVKAAGPVGMAIATALATVLFIPFIFSYTELATAIPSSGGPFAYAERALGRWGALVAGFATLVEFVIAPPAIARAIGSYVNFRFGLPVIPIAVGAFVVFGVINAIGVSLAATFELFITLLATAELLLYFGLTGPHIDWSKFSITGAHALPFGWKGVFAALPFGIWFYLGIEGVAMSAEETKHPVRDIPRGYVAGILTLVLLATGTLLCTVGVLPTDQLVIDDSPLPRALAAVLSPSHPMTHLMVYLGLFGLVASFHGIMMGYSRQVFALGRAGYLPSVFGRLHPRWKTPLLAIFVPGVLGAVCAAYANTDILIALSGLGAVLVYGTSMLSLFALRKKEPELHRPYRAPFYPVFPGIALAMAALIFVAFAASSPAALAILAGLFGVAVVHFVAITRRRLDQRAAAPNSQP